MPKPPTTGIRVRDSHAYLGWLAGLAGDTTAAEEHFTTADQICLTDHDEHLSSFDGVLWARWLARTGRLGPARDLTRRNAEHQPRERLERRPGPV